MLNFVSTSWYLSSILMVLRCSDMDVVHNEEIDFGTDKDSEGFYKHLPEKYNEKTENQLYAQYLLHPNNVHVVKSP